MIHAKKTYNYLERDEKARTEFIEKLPLYPPEQLIYMDESGIDSNESSPYSWCKKGQRFQAQRPGKGEKDLVSWEHSVKKIPSTNGISRILHSTINRKIATRLFAAIS